MPESFDRILAEMAEEAVGETRTPMAADVRRRGAQRTTRRRLIASMTAFIAVCGMLAGGVAERVLGAGPSAPVLPAASLSAPAPSGSPSPSPAGALPQAADPTASASPNKAARLNLGLAAGLWARSDGSQGYLIIYPLSMSGSDSYAMVGISEPGYFPLCYGRLALSSVGSVYPVTSVTCPGGAAPDMAVTYSDAAPKRLVLHGSASTDGQDVATSYSIQAFAAVTTNVHTTLGVVTGTWVAGSTVITIAKQGSVTWSAQVDGSEQTGTGKAIAGSFADGMVVSGTCLSGKELCTIFQLGYDAKTGQLTVIGSEGLQVFDRKG